MTSSQQTNIHHCLKTLLFICAGVLLFLPALPAHAGSVEGDWVAGTNSVCTNFFLGKVGIGTNSPSTTLDVHGGLKVSATMTVPRQGDVDMGGYTNGVSAGGVDGALPSAATGNLMYNNGSKWTALTNFVLDTATGDLDAEGNKITDLANPSAAQDAATKTYVDLGKPPIGTIMAFLQNYLGAASLASIRSNGWAVCNGTTPASQGISSPVITTTPNLNSGNRFLRGASTSGGTGGESRVTITTTTMPSHNHGAKSAVQGQWGSSCWTPNSGGTQNYDTCHAGGSQDHENKPPFYDVVWIMRVK